MRKLIIEKQEQLRQLALELQKLVDLTEGTADVVARALTDDEKQKRTDLRDKIEKAQEELVELQERYQAEQVLKRRVPAVTPEEKKIAQRFSYARAVRMAAKQAGYPVTIENEDYGVEKEMHQEAEENAKRSGVSTPAGKAMVYIPTFLNEQKRATAGNPANAGNLTLKTTDYNHIDHALPMTVLERAGARVIDNLVGTMEMPVGDAIGQYAYNTENGTLAAAGATFGLKQVAPKRGGVTEPVSFMLINQESLGIESWLQGHFGELERIGVEKAFLMGGGPNEPVGLIAAAGIPLEVIGANGGALTEDIYDAAVKRLKTNNRFNGNITLITTPGIAQRMGKIPRDAGSGIFLMNVDTMVAKNGIPVLESNILPTNLIKGSSTDCNPVLLGDFTKFIYMKWRFNSFTIDPYTGAKEGLMNLTLNTYNNCFWSQDKSFVRILDARDI